MKQAFRAILTTAFIALWTFTNLGCHHQPSANTELEKATAELAKGEPAPPAPTPTPAPAPAPVQPQVVQIETPAQLPSQQMNQAVVAYKAGNLEDAVTRLQKLRASPVLTPQQRLALNDAMAAVMTEIYTMAEKGDARAIAAVKQYEYMNTHR